MAAELESKLDESSKLYESSGGVFEIQRNGELIYSKKATGRFPEEGEVLEIIRNLDAGLSLQEAQAKAGENARKPPSFFDWFHDVFGKRSTGH